MRALNRLSARGVANLTKPGRHADGGGLYLAISPDGSRRRWVFLFTLNGRQREMGLGSVQDVTLADARAKAGDARSLLAAGIDPLEARRTAEKTGTAPTFGEVADAHIESMRAGWRNPKHVAQWRTTLSRVRDADGRYTEDGFCVSIRNKPVDAIDTEAVLGVLKGIWTTKPETAARVRGRIEAVLDAARAAGHRTGENPARWRGHLALLLPKPTKLSRGHHAAMPFTDVPEFIGQLRLVRGVGAFALEFAILTAARSGEVREARWSEIDLVSKVWTVPASRMKAGRVHRVPLSDRAVEVLKIVAPLRRASEDDPLVFPSTRPGRPLSDMTLVAVLRRHAPGFTVHGFRSSFRDWCGDATTFQREVVEAALAHAVGDATEAAYRRSDALEKRRKLMAAWASYCEPKAAANVTPLVPKASGK